MSGAELVALRDGAAPSQPFWVRCEEDNPRLTGRQTPEVDVRLDPAGLDFTHAERAIKLAKLIGLDLFPWQRYEVALLLAQVDGRWAHSNYVLVVPRQNGKSVVAEVVLLYCLVKLNMKIIFTAHRWKTAQSIRDRLWRRVESKPWMRRLVRRNTNSQGQAELELKTGGYVQFSTRSANTSRGFDRVDLLIFDEAYNMDDSILSAMAPIQLASPDPLTMAMSSPVNRAQHPQGQWLSDQRHKALTVRPPGTRYVEYRAPDGLDPDSPETWALANPSYGVVSTERTVAKVHAVQSARSFAVEMLGQGDWFPPIGTVETAHIDPILDLDSWEAAAVDSSALDLSGRCALAVDVTPQGDAAALAAAAMVGEKVHVALAPLTEFNRDVLVSAITSAVEKNDPLGVVVDDAGPASTLPPLLLDKGLGADTLRPSDVADACELFLTLFNEGKITHDLDSRWAEALGSAQFRTLRGGRALTAVGVEPIAPLVAATFAVWRLFKPEIEVELPKVKVKRPLAKGVKPLTVPGDSFNSIDF